MGTEIKSETELRFMEDFGEHYDNNCIFHRNLKFVYDLDMRADDKFSREVYQALCNMRWRKKGFINYIRCLFLRRRSEALYSCSWRFAGGLVAEIRNFGENYLDFYCSGGEGRVTKRVRERFAKMGEGWVPFPWNHWNGKLRRFWRGLLK